MRDAVVVIDRQDFQFGAFDNAPPPMPMDTQGKFPFSFR